MLKPKRLAAPDEVPPIVLLADVVEHADVLPRFAPLALVPKRFPMTTSFVPTDQKAGSGVEAEDVGGAGRVSRRSCCAPVVEHADGIAHVGAAGIGAEEIADDDFVVRC